MTATVEYKVNRAGWDSGPWDDEPDRIEFRHAGLPCLMQRVHHGAWCGYVAVAKGHPCYGLDYTTEYPKGDDGEPDYGQSPLPNPVNELDAHGGITYGNACRGRICHVPAPGEPDDVWWLGFDCVHYMDFAPGHHASIRSVLGREPAGLSSHGTYRDAAYVRGECHRLADQLAAMVST